MNELYDPTRITAQKSTFKDLKDLERKPLRHCEGDGKVTFTKLFLMSLKGIVKVMYIINIYKPLMALFPKLTVLKGLVSHSGWYDVRG